MDTHELKIEIIDTLALSELGLASAFDAQALADRCQIPEDNVQTALQELRTAGDVDGYRQPGSLNVGSPHLTPSARWRWSLAGAKHHLPDFDAQALKVHAHLHEHHQATAAQIQALLGMSHEETQRYLTLMDWGNSIRVHRHPDDGIANIGRK